MFLPAAALLARTMSVPGRPVAASAGLVVSEVSVIVVVGSWSLNTTSAAYDAFGIGVAAPVEQMATFFASPTQRLSHWLLQQKASAAQTFVAQSLPAPHEHAVWSSLLPAVHSECSQQFAMAVYTGLPVAGSHESFVQPLLSDAIAFAV